MGRRVEVVIGPYVFKTKKEAKETIIAVKNVYPDGEVLREPEHSLILELIAKHPRADEKIGCGIREFSVGPDIEFNKDRCFYLKRLDGSASDFSLHKCIDGEKEKDLIYAALRSEIIDFVRLFRDGEFAKGPRTCPFTGSKLNLGSCHVDHAPPSTFNHLVRSWLSHSGFQVNEIKISLGADMTNSRVMTDADQRMSWRKFHDENACLRLTSPLGNLSHSKLQANGKL